MTKTEAYQKAGEEIVRRLQQEDHLIANLGNVSAILKEYMEDINWVGFYLFTQNQLILGPFQGRAACTRIGIGKGVCGTSFQEGVTKIVPDVEKFPGHIACDSRSKSEIVIPMIFEGKKIGVLDIDSPIYHRFDATDQAFLEELVEWIVQSCKINENEKG